MRQPDPLRPFAVRHAKSRRRRPALEGLESRQLLAARIAEYPTFSAESNPAAIVEGPDGNLYYADFGLEAIGEIDPRTHAVTVYPVPQAESFLAPPIGLASGNDGNLWFSERGTTGSAMVRFNPTTHAFSAFELPPNPDFYEFRISTVAGGPGGTVWFSFQRSRGYTTDFGIGVIDPRSGAVAEFSTGPDIQPTSFAFDASGNAWFAVGYYGPSPAAYGLGEFNVVTHAFAYYGSDVPAGSLALGPDGNIWFTELLANKVGWIDPATGAIGSTYLPTPRSTPGAIVAGADGNLWFTEIGYFGNSAIASINPTTHMVTTHPTPSVAAFSFELTQPGITAGPGGSLWFTENNVGQIGEVQMLPADGPRVTSVRRLGVHNQTTRLVLAFDQPLDPTTAQLASNYRVVGPRGQSIPVASAVYDASAGIVTLRPVARLALRSIYGLSVTGTGPTGVANTYGQLLDGAGTGQPGSDYVAFVTRANLAVGRPVPHGPARAAHPLARWRR